MPARFEHFDGAGGRVTIDRTWLAREAERGVNEIYEYLGKRDLFERYCRIRREGHQ